MLECEKSVGRKGVCHVNLWCHSSLLLQTAIVVPCGRARVRHVPVQIHFVRPQVGPQGLRTVLVVVENVIFDHVFS